MKKVFLSIVALAALVALPMSVSAQKTVTSSNVTSKAKIIKPIKIELDGNELNFGTIASGELSSVVTLLTDKTRTYTGDVTLITEGSQNISTNVPEITVSGEKNAGYTIVINTSSVTLTGTTASNTMTVSNFTTNIPTTPFIGNLGASGQQKFKIGADLTVAAQQAADLYSGSFTVTTAYN